MKYLITGVTGSGKSTIAEGLKKRGLIVFDTDDITRWEDDTGRPDEPTEHPTKEWLEHHHWNINKDELQKILNRDGDAYLCGTASDLKSFFPDFDKIFILVIDQPELIERLNNRTTNPFGKSPEEQADIFSWHKWYEQNLIEQGAVPIDATEPFDKVVDKILSYVSK